MTKQRDYASVMAIFARFHKAVAEPQGELHFADAFTLLVAVVLSAQATDVGVNKATATLFAAAATPARMVALGEDDLISHIRSIGLYRTKARNVIALSQRLIDSYDGQVPSSRAALQSLPGVGRKTANVVLNTWFGFPAQAVDTHLFRVCNRTGLAPGKDELAVERALEDHVPVAYQRHAHQWLILHGRYTCMARKPKCATCIIQDHCSYKEKTA